MGFEPDSASDCRDGSYGNPAGAGVVDLYANQPDSTLMAPELARVIEAWRKLT